MTLDRARTLAVGATLVASGDGKYWTCNLSIGNSAASVCTQSSTSSFTHLDSSTCSQRRNATITSESFGIISSLELKETSTRTAPILSQTTMLSTTMDQSWWVCWLLIEYFIDLCSALQQHGILNWRQWHDRPAQRYEWRDNGTKSANFSERYLESQPNVLRWGDRNNHWRTINHWSNSNHWRTTSNDRQTTSFYPRFSPRVENAAPKIVGEYFWKHQTLLSKIKFELKGFQWT